MRLLIIADTHIPARAKDLPAEVWRAVAAADLVVHAGDWVDAEFAESLQERSTRLLGVAGNNDPAVLHRRFPEVASTEVAGVRLSVVHETGPARGRETRCAKDFPDTDVLVFGHSHIPWDSSTETGLRLLNPGSPTDRRRQPHFSYLTAEAAAGSLTAVRLHTLPPAGPPSRGG